MNRQVGGKEENSCVGDVGNRANLGQIAGSNSGGDSSIYRYVAGLVGVPQRIDIVCSTFSLIVIVAGKGALVKLPWGWSNVSLTALCPPWCRQMLQAHLLETLCGGSAPAGESADGDE